jgi:hypothetical protein
MFWCAAVHQQIKQHVVQLKLQLEQERLMLPKQ